MIGLLPAEVDSIDRERRIARVRIPGLTDGAAELPEAEFCNPIGDKSEHTEIRVIPGDRVWLAFQAGDTRYPVIVGYRPKNQENGIDWRRFHHGNFEFNADNTIHLIAGTQVKVTAPLVLAEADLTRCTGALTVEGLLTFNGGMSGKAGAGGGPAMIVSGGAAFSEDVVAAGTSVDTHGHMEQGDNNRVSNPVA